MRNLGASVENGGDLGGAVLDLDGVFRIWMFRIWVGGYKKGLGFLDKQ